MTVTLTLGWWIVPLAITVGSLAWAIPMRQSERPDGSMFSGLGYAIGGTLRVAGAIIVSLVAWLVWSLVT